MWLKSEEKFLRDNWTHMSNDVIGDYLHKSNETVSAKGIRLGMPRKKRGTTKYSLLGDSAKQHHEYIQALNNIRSLKRFKQTFNLTGWQKLVIPATEVCKKERLVNGNVISQTDNIITLQLKNYRESFRIIAFFTGEIYKRETV